MFDRICLYNNKVFYSSITEHDAYLIVSECKIAPKLCFKEINKLKISLRSSFKPKEVLLDVVDHFIFGFKCIVILVIGHSKDFHVFFYCNTIRNRLMDVKYIKNSFNYIPNHDILLTHGPTLLASAYEIFEFYSLPNSIISSFNLKSIFPIKNTKILQFSCIGQILREDPLNVILLVVSGESANKQKLGIFAIGMHFENNKVSVEQLNTNLFFPEFLNNFIKSIEVSGLCISEQLNSRLSDINWKNNMSILCTQSEFFAYCKGKLKYAISLPFKNTSVIKVTFPSLSFRNLNLILLFNEHQLCLLKPIKSSNELQLKKSWSGIKNLLLGDILLNGSSQMLLIKSQDVEHWNEEYILTDISNFTPVEILDQTAIPDECLNATLSGLEAKYQVGKLAVSEEECEIMKKTEATLDALDRLEKINMGQSGDHHVSSFQESLVDIILQKDENCKMEVDEVKDCPTLKLINHWVKFFSNCWFLCWTFLNEGNRPICYPTMKIIIANQKIQCAGRVFIHSSSLFSLEDKSAKQINPQQTFSVLSRLENVTFLNPSIKVNAILSWFIGTYDEYENELFLPFEEKCLIQNQLILDTTLKAIDEFNNGNQDITKVEDLFCLKVLQQKVAFKVSSLYSKLCNIENNLLLSELGSQKLVLLENSTLKILIFKNKESSHQGLHFIFKHINVNNVELEAFCKNDKELFVLLKFLQQCLPKDLVFIPSIKTCDEIMEMKQKFVCAMKEETDLLASALHAHNISSQIQEFSSVAVEAGKIIMPKKTFLRIRKALVKKECITDIILRNFYCIK